MSNIVTAFGKMAFLLSSKAKRQYGGQICHHVLQALNKSENATDIQDTFGVVPRGYILVTDLHSSRSDPEPHFTVDVYGVDTNGNDLPIGCIHVYANSRLTSFTNARTKALEAYERRVAPP